ncbi:tandem-95 repeat protein [Pseudomonas sp. EA_35y_Pfl2_R5]|uniref:tandem-95 repeat protein n=1 Tax=Pseudomonas sp. EA_35y_Pfl2_R5 TaxID=3088690 RepID=UPI0030D7E9C8
MGNDSDVDGDTLTIASVTSGNGGTAVLNPDGTVTFTPNANFNGVADFTYTVTDGALTSNTATVTVNVAPGNDAPVAVNDSLIASEDTPITYTANDLLGNDSDVDGDPLTIASVTSGNGGTAVLNPDGTVTFTPNANFNGVADFTYTVTDGALTSNTATVTVNVAPANDAPVAVADTFTLNEDESLTVTSAAGVLANDSDIDGDALTASLVSGPAQGSLTLNADGSFSYTPTPNWSGSDSFTYRTFDGTTFSNPVTVTLNVVPVADTPDLQLNGSRVLASTDFESAALNGASWSAGINSAGLNNGVGSAWQTDNPGGQVEIGQQSVYMGGNSTNQVIELERNSGDASNLFTNVTATAGATYSLDFDYSPRNGGLATSNIEVYWDGNLLGTLSSAAVGFTPYHFDLPVPADGTYKLEFRAVDSTSVGGLLDNIVLSDVRNIGNEDSWIRLSDISANLTDTDGSETLQITIDSLPAGSFLRDNNGNLFEATGSNVADITGWDKSTLSFLPPPNYNGSLTLNVTATATETANSDQSATSAPLNVTVNPVNDGPVAGNDVVTPGSIRSGLHADFYNYREGAVASGFDGPNMASISQAEAFIASSQANAIFVASSLSFTPTLTHLGSGTELETFLGSASSSLVDINRLSTIDAVVHMRGQIDLAAGTYNFRINADDGYIIRINGEVVASLNGTNTNNTSTHSNFSIADSGLQDIEIVYYDQGGFSRFNAELRSNGAGPYEPVTDSMLSHSPALYGGVETYSISAAELLANDSDADSGDVLSITAVSGAIGGTVSLSADFSTVTFVREAGFTGTPSFTYTVTDTAGATSNAQVQINPTSTLISGSAAADILIGDADDNLIMGLAGNDTLTGAGGSDTFIWLKGHTGNDTISDFNISTDLDQRDRLDLHDLLQGENEGNINNYLQVVSTPLETTLQISTNGQFNVGGSADLSIRLENGGAPVDLSSFGATSSQIVNSLIAGADPIIKVDHS